MPRKRVLDLFCGGGGSSYGARAAGAIIVGGVDAWDVASQTYAANFPRARALNFRLEGAHVLPEVTSLGRIDILLASPECTNHTCARGSRPICESSRLTAWQVIHYARALRPEWIIIENVVQMQSWERFHEFKVELAKDYQISTHVLDASCFGVPQTRRRLFLVCSRAGSQFVISSEATSHCVARSILDPPGTWKTNPLHKHGRAEATLARAERAITELGRREPFLLVYYGSNSSGGWQSLDRPLRTMTTLDRFALVEPSIQGHSIRMLQVPELRRAMGFGDDYILSKGTRRDKVRVLGNGVCPPVMTSIVESIIKKNVST
jgi:DNA (cytosine-5)-methyltransferase 1